MAVILNHKRLRKESRIARLQNQLDLITYIANEYERTLIKIAQHADKFAYVVNPARAALQKINYELTVRR